MNHCTEPEAGRLDLDEGSEANGQLKGEPGGEEGGHQAHLVVGC